MDGVGDVNCSARATIRCASGSTPARWPRAGCPRATSSPRSRGQRAGRRRPDRPAARCAGRVPVEMRRWPAHRRRAVRGHRGARRSGRRRRPRPRRRQGRARRAGLHGQRLSEQRRGDGLVIYPAARLQRAGDGGRGRRRDGRSRRRISRRASTTPSSTTRPNSSAVDRRGRAHAVRGDRRSSSSW